MMQNLDLGFERLPNHKVMMSNIGFVKMKHKNVLHPIESLRMLNRLGVKSTIQGKT